MNSVARGGKGKVSTVTYNVPSGVVYISFFIRHFPNCFCSLQLTRNLSTLSSSSNVLVQLWEQKKVPKPRKK